MVFLKLFLPSLTSEKHFRSSRGFDSWSQYTHTQDTTNFTVVQCVPNCVVTAAVEGMQWDQRWTGNGWGWGGLSLFKVTSRRSTRNSGTVNTIAGGSVKVRTVYLQNVSYTVATLIYYVFRKEIIGLKYNIRLRLLENAVNGKQFSIKLVSRHMLGQDLPGSAARVLHCWLCAVCMRVALGDVIWHPYHRAGCTRSAIAIKTVRAPRGGERSWFLTATLFPHISHSSRLSANRLRAAERNRIWS